VTTPQQAANLKRAFAEHDIPWPTAPRKRTLYFSNAGPMMQYADGTLYISDLNPEVEIKWRMSRSDMLKFAARCIRAALSR
jgi:hypothetical protein